MDSWNVRFSMNFLRSVDLCLSLNIVLAVIKVCFSHSPFRLVSFVSIFVIKFYWFSTVLISIWSLLIGWREQWTWLIKLHLHLLKTGRLLVLIWGHRRYDVLTIITLKGTGSRFYDWFEGIIVRSARFLWLQFLYLERHGFTRTFQNVCCVESAKFASWFWLILFDAWFLTLWPSNWNNFDLESWLE